MGRHEKLGAKKIAPIVSLALSTYYYLLRLSILVPMWINNTTRNTSTSWFQQRQEDVQIVQVFSGPFLSLEGRN